MTISLLLEQATWTAKRPNFSASSMKGLRVFAAPVSSKGAFTANSTSSPLRAASTWLAIITATLVWDSKVLAPMWGVTTMLGAFSKMLSVAGSFVKTSTAAALTLPLVSAS